MCHIWFNKLMWGFQLFVWNVKHLNPRYHDTHHCISHDMNHCKLKHFNRSLHMSLHMSLLMSLLTASLSSLHKITYCAFFLHMFLFSRLYNFSNYHLAQNTFSTFWRWSFFSSFVNTFWKFWIQISCYKRGNIFSKDFEICDNLCFCPCIHTGPLLISVTS